MVIPKKVDFWKNILAFKFGGGGGSEDFIGNNIMHWNRLSFNHSDYSKHVNHIELFKLCKQFLYYGAENNYDRKLIFTECIICS